MNKAACFTAAILAGLCQSAGAADVSWLPEVTTVPADSPSPSPTLRPVLVTAEGRPISTREEWEAARTRLRQDWLDFLGPLPEPPAEVRVETLHEERLDRVVRSLVRYEAEPGRSVEAYLLRPADAKPGERRPAVVVFHPTNKETIAVVAGTGGRPEQHLGLRLAERGFVALCPRNFLWEAETLQASTAAVRRRHPESRGMATMLADGFRAVDALASLPDVDADRIGAIGHSLGGKEALYLLAFDDRVKAAVASEGGVGMTFTNWDAPWYLGPEVRRPGFARDHHEVVALAAPRPLLVLAGEAGPGCADGERTWPYVAAGQAVSRLYGVPVRQALLNHRRGHTLEPDVAEKAYEWLEVYLGG